MDKGLKLPTYMCGLDCYALEAVTLRLVGATE